MKKRTFISFIIGISLLILLITGCSKDVQTEQPNNTEASVEQVDDTNTELDTPNQDPTETTPVIEQPEVTTEEQPQTSTDPQKDKVIEDTKLAKDYNTEGFRLYKEGKYKDALELFKKSYELDDNYCHAHFNYACTLGVLMKEEYEVYYEYKSEAIDHLAKVIALDDKYVEKVKTDTDLDPLRDQLRYYTDLLGLSVEKSEDITTMLRSLKWYIEGPGVISVYGGIEFTSDTEFTLTYLDTSDLFKNGGDVKNINYTGTYTIEGTSIKLVLDEKMLRRRSMQDIADNTTEYDETTELNGTFTKDGFITIDIFEYPIKWYYEEFSA